MYEYKYVIYIYNLYNIYIYIYYIIYKLYIYIYILYKVICIYIYGFPFINFRKMLKTFLTILQKRLYIDTKSFSQSTTYLDQELALG